MSKKRKLKQPKEPKELEELEELELKNTGAITRNSTHSSRPHAPITFLDSSTHDPSTHDPPAIGNLRMQAKQPVQMVAGRSKKSRIKKKKETRNGRKKKGVKRRKSVGGKRRRKGKKTKKKVYCYR